MTSFLLRYSLVYSKEFGMKFCSVLFSSTSRWWVPPYYLGLRGFLQCLTLIRFYEVELKYHQRPPFFKNCPKCYCIESLGEQKQLVTPSVTPGNRSPPFQCMKNWHFIQQRVLSIAWEHWVWDHGNNSRLDGAIKV